MADLNARIKPKKSSTTGEVPQAADLEVAEIAVNTADGKLFVKHTDNSIKEISGSGGGLDLEDLNNVLDLAATVYQFTGTNTATYPTQAGGEFYATGSASSAYFDDVDANGADFATIALTKVVGDKIWISTDGVSFTEYEVYVEDVSITFGANKIRINSTIAWPNSYNGGNLNDVYVAWSDPGVTAPADGQVLTWSSANSQWEPADAAGGATEINDLTDVETTTQITTGEYGNTSSFPNFNGGCRVWTSSSPDQIQINRYDTTGTDWSAVLAAIKSGDTFQAYPISNPGAIQTFTALSDAVQNGSDSDVYEFDISDADGAVIIFAPKYFVFGGAPTDGQVLTWVDANSQWEPGNPALRNSADLDGIVLEEGAGLIYDAVNGIFKQNQQASDILSAMAYKFKNTLSGDPSTGHIALDNADPSLATEIRIHKTTTNGVDLTNIFSAGVGTAQGIYIQRKDNASEAHFFRTTGPATDSGTYMTVGVQHVSGTGTFTNNKVMAVGVYAKGESAALAPLSVPSTATDAGTAGDIRYDAGYVYICVAANTWKRAALTSW